MLETTPSTRCAYDDCPIDSRLAVLIIEREDGRLERHVCAGHHWAAATITERLDGLAYRLAPIRW